MPAQALAFNGGNLAAVSASSYSFASMVQRFGPLMRKGGSFLALTYMAGERVIPGYGGGMSSAKAALESDVRTLLRDKDVRHAGIARSGDSLVIRFHDPATRSQASTVIRDAMTDLAVREDTQGSDPVLIAALTPAARKATQDNALTQNITTLHNRINELGVAEPVIQQQGADRVVVELPDPTTILIRGADKQKVGQFAADVRRVRKPEPYKGKGIRYDNEQVRRKEGKSFTSGAT